MSAGVTRPGRSAAICAGGAAVGAAMLAWGVATMAAVEGETPRTALAVGLGLFLVLTCPLLLLNFLWAARIVARLRRGDGVIARWTVGAEVLDQFRDDERRRVAAGDDNDWRTPRTSPAAGVEVIFAEDAVLVGDTLFGLASTGIAHVRAVETLADSPLTLRFETAMTAVEGAGRNGSIVTRFGSLRIPVAPGANEALQRVVGHYRLVLAGERLVKPGFWKLRIRVGLGVAIASAFAAAAGFGMNALGIDGVVPLALAVVGVITGAGGLVLAAIAARFARRQRSGW